MSLVAQLRALRLPAPVAHYFAYTRPLTLLPTFILVATGYALAPAHTFASCISDVVFLFLVYCLCGWGGASAFNSGQDRDAGKVNLLNNPPPLPPGLSAFGLALSLCGVLLCLVWPSKLRVLPWTLASGVLSIVYSWKAPWWTRGKDVPGVDVAIHAVGAGLVTIGLGLAAGGTRPVADVVWVGMAFSIALLGGYPTTQIFQLEGRASDEKIDFTSWLGPARALRLGATAFVIHIVALVGWWGFRQTRTTVLALVALFVWLVLVLASTAYAVLWARRPFDRPYERMTTQMGAMLASQLAFTTALAVS